VHLKIILLVQSSSAALYACFVMIAFSKRIWSWNPFEMDDPMNLALGGFFLFMMMLVGHVLLIERVMATMMVRRYENWKSWSFCAGWIIILVVIN
jgi:hypothetical protein